MTRTGSEPVLTSHRVGLAYAAGALLLGLPALLAAQTYELRLSPAAGDTLRMQLDQQTEVSGPGGTTPRTMRSRFQIFSRAIVTGKQGGTTSITAVTDSVAMDSDDEHARGIAERARRAVAGQQVRLRLASDGTVRLVDEAGKVTREMSETVSLIPAALPKAPLAVGDTWVRSMPLPVGPTVDAGAVIATFRLDSVSRGGRVAYVSVKGNLARDPAPAAGPRGTMMKVAGTVAGTLQLDRVRGWIRDSRFVVTMHSALEPPAGSGVAPVKFKTVVTQWMRLRERPSPQGRGTRR